MKKFNKEINLLKNLREDVSVLHALHPLTKAQLKNKILTNLKTTIPQEATRYYRQGRRQKLIRYIVSILLGLSLIGGTAFASNGAVPGDVLYPVKQIKETVELNLAPSESYKAQLQVKFTGERLNELTKVHAQAQAQIRTQGKIEADTAQAEDQAQAELQNAIQTLAQTQAQLEAKGNIDAATGIGQALLRLQGTHQDGIEVQIQFPRRQKEEENQTPNPNNKDDSGLIRNNGQVQVQIKIENLEEEHSKQKNTPAAQPQGRADFSATGTLESNLESATNTPIQNQVRINRDEQGQENDKTGNESRKNPDNANGLQDNLNNFLGN